MIYNKFKIRTKQAGFTVLESIVAIFILSLSISGVFSAVQQSLSQATLSKEEVKAFYLAQEAVEIIRNKRDSNQLRRINTGAGDWLDGIATVCTFSSGSQKNLCTVNATNLGIFNCGGAWAQCPVLRQDDNSFVYGYDSSDPATNFTREIFLEKVRDDAFGNPAEIAVNVNIKWTKGVITRNFKVKTYLLNWAK